MGRRQTLDEIFGTAAGKDIRPKPASYLPPLAKDVPTPLPSAQAPTPEAVQVSNHQQHSSKINNYGRNTLIGVIR